MKPLIKNAQIEEMFYRIATDYNVGIYHKHIDNGSVALATAYASRIVRDKFFALVQEEETRANAYKNQYKVKVSKFASLG